ncbi:MAG TPA: MerR family transcriptional regulator [Thermoanaerobaculia bacterium]|jgi:DNA-binding transcriptional MerR regulator/methylmalonyl-CoA mutase cobalamin-binding subunit|nr:MerR family transcriptional regulator [Thermoanaerobaculia bacterium]
MSTSTSSALRHPIGVVSRRTGLKPDLIRAWERRYGAVAPGRTDTRRRFYSDADISRLLLLKRVVDTGRSISQVANLSNEELDSLVEPGKPAPAHAAGDPSGGPFGGPSGGDTAADLYLELCLSAARRLEVGELELHLQRASVALSRAILLDKLLVPLLRRVGELWQDGEMRPTHEHVASAVVRSFLGGMYHAYDIPATAPHLIATTPQRQRHELGALMVAAVAAGEGWRATYLGPDLPSEEIAAAATEKGAQAVALSLIYPPDDPGLADDLRRLRRLLSPSTVLLAGGRACSAYGAVLDEIGAIRVPDLPTLRRELDRLRG